MATKTKTRSKTKGNASRAACAASRLRRCERGSRIGVYLPRNLEADFRKRCARERRSLSDAATSAIQTWMLATIELTPTPQPEPEPTARDIPMRKGPIANAWLACQLFVYRVLGYL
jgi:hypothetical protein